MVDLSRDGIIELIDSISRGTTQTLNRRSILQMVEYIGSRCLKHILIDMNIELYTV